MAFRVKYSLKMRLIMEEPMVSGASFVVGRFAV